jgi:hypothetical protein
MISKICSKNQVIMNEFQASASIVKIATIIPDFVFPILVIVTTQNSFPHQKHSRNIAVNMSHYVVFYNQGEAKKPVERCIC